MSFVYHGVPRSSQELVYKCPCFRGSNWNLGENWSTRRKKTLGADYKTNNKLKPDMTPGPRIEPGTPAGLDKGT